MGWGRYFEGSTYFWQVAEGGALFLAQKNYKKPVEQQFLGDLAKNKGQLFWQVRPDKISTPLVHK